MGDAGQITILVFANIDSQFDVATPDAIAQAREALSALNREGVPLVLCSSYPRAQVEALRQSLDLHHPFICERGCAVFVPAGYFSFNLPGLRVVADQHVLELGRPHHDVSQTLLQLAAEQGVRLRTFGQMSVDEVATDCGLTVPQARLAKLMEYSERFKIIDATDMARQRLFTAMEQASMRCITGRPYHYAGSAVDPSLSTSRVYALYRLAHSAVVSIGAADATLPFSTREGHWTGSFSPVPDLAAWSEKLLDHVMHLRRAGIYTST